MFSFSILLDSWYFGEFPTFTHFNFAKFNVIEGGAGEYFGKSNVFQYFVWIFLYMGGLSPFVFIGMFIDLKTSIKNLKFSILPSICFGYLLILSLISHKEVRFMLPLTFIFCYFSSIGLLKFPRIGFIILAVTFIYWSILTIMSGVVKNNSHLANDYIYDEGYESVYWSDNESSNYLADLHPGFQDPKNLKVVANQIVQIFARKGFPNVKYLEHSTPEDIAYDSVLELSEKYKITRTLALKIESKFSVNEDKLSVPAQTCKDSSYLPQCFIFRHKFPDNLMFKKLFKWLEAPYVWQEGNRIKLLPYKQVFY